MQNWQVGTIKSDGRAMPLGRDHQSRDALGCAREGLSIASAIGDRCVDHIRALRKAASACSVSPNPCSERPRFV